MKPVPAVRRRLDAHEDCRAHLASCRVPSHHPLFAACETLNRHIHSIPDLLHPWLAITLPVQPCLCDCWHDNLLFVGNELTGLIDYGAVKVDHVAVDLARLLGSLVSDDDTGWRMGLTAYREVRPLSPQEEELARVLDRTGCIIALWTWVRRLLIEQRQYPDAAVSARVGDLIARLGS